MHNLWNSGLTFRIGRRKIAKKENFKSEVISILNQWMMNHLSYPYPNKSDCEQITALTGLSAKQIRVWCTNTRKRRLNVTRNDFSFNAFHNQIMQHEAQNLYGKQWFLNLSTYQNVDKSFSGGLVSSSLIQNLSVDLYAFINPSYIVC